MNVPNIVQVPKLKFYIITFISLITICLIIVTSVTYTKKYSFGRSIFLNVFSNASLSITTSISTPIRSAESISTTTYGLTDTTQLLNTTLTTDFNQVLCNNLTDSGHPLNHPNNPCEKLRCAITVHRNGGRLGNRMFIFASAYGLARTHGCRFYVGDSIMYDLRDTFTMSMKENLWLSIDQANGLFGSPIKDTVCSFLPEMLRPNAFQNIELQGYWQSYLYFDGYRDEIREMFTGRPKILARLADYFFNLTRIDCPACEYPATTSHNELRQIIRTRYNIIWIGIHIRRHDFARLGFASSDQYIRQAMAYYKRRFYKQKLRFLVASDDKTYCYQLFVNEINLRQVFILPITFPRGEDLIALSFCHHSIITGGTYGFWAAYLAGGEVIHDVAYSAGCSRLDYYPPWFKIPGDPKRKTR